LQNGEAATPWVSGGKLPYWLRWNVAILKQAQGQIAATTLVKVDMRDMLAKQLYT
jgi:hypothetical protein